MNNLIEMYKELRAKQLAAATEAEKAQWDNSIIAVLRAIERVGE